MVQIVRRLQGGGAVGAALVPQPQPQPQLAPEPEPEPELDPWDERETILQPTGLPAGLQAGAASASPADQARTRARCGPRRSAPRRSSAHFRTFTPIHTFVPGFLARALAARVPARCGHAAAAAQLTAVRAEVKREVEVAVAELAW